MSITVANRVKSGALLLDRMMPGWQDEIDICVLRMGHPSYCILGQLFRAVPLMSGYYFAVNWLRDHYRNARIADRFVIRNGFTADNLSDFAWLEEYWHDEIQNRRKARGKELANV